MNRAIGFTVKELWERGSGGIPEEMQSAAHLIYSSPATLAFNSPGAEGFGVKRAGLSVPGSVMLIVSPGCCGRNTSSISTMKGYENRFFYLTMDETDLVTGRHLKRIPGAVLDLAQRLTPKPSVVMICITCVDALLGTDMERVCKKAEDLLGEKGMHIRVRPCYMYALTREGRKPPMVHVRQSIYSLLQPLRKKADSVNLMGYFAPLDKGSELRTLLYRIGVKKIREVSSCADYGEFLSMAEANFNLVLNPEARLAAQDLEERLGIPSIELTRLYQIDRIASQYDALGAALGVRFSYESFRDRAKESMKRFREAFPGAQFSVGEALNADPFELSLALVRYGFKVREIFGTLTPDSYRYLRHLAELSPETKVYSNLSPSMLAYRSERGSRPGENAGDRNTKEQHKERLFLCVGRDAGWYHPEDPCLQWVQDIQPFGFDGVRRFFDALYETAKGERKDLYSSEVRLGEDKGERKERNTGFPVSSFTCAKSQAAPAKEAPPKGYRRVLTPFAPDQSGAVSVLYELGGITVICDAGGCTGNICGFDEPRWFRERSAVFSAGLRDMDAILGRDEKLVQKLSDTAAFMRESDGPDLPGFASIIGTPVPAVIGTDLKALERMAEKRAGLPCIGIACSGMEYYDKGAQEAYLALFEKFAIQSGSGKEQPEAATGILGAQYMDLGGIAEPGQIRSAVEESTGNKAIVFGTREDGIRAFQYPEEIRENLVVTVSGYEAARRLKKKYGIPYRCGNPLAERILRGICPEEAVRGKKVLVIHEQITAGACRKRLLEMGARQVNTASWFMMKKELMEEGDVRLREETDPGQLVSEGGYDVVIADQAMFPLLRDCFEGTLIPLRHFAVSGSLQTEQ